MRILGIDGHPDAGSYGDAVARSYVEGAESGGHDVRVFCLREMHFDRSSMAASRSLSLWSLISSRLVMPSAGANTLSSSLRAGGGMCRRC